MRVGTRVWLVAGLLAMSLTACRDNALPDRNLPVQEARHRTYGYPVYERAGTAPEFTVGGRHWLASLPLQTIPPHLLVSVGGSEGTAVYALRGETAPYSALYLSAGGNRWRPLVRIN
ncbi:MAG TPA: hypothetical protein VMN60_13595 [Longimicrobiales bacterium]|nr:hypothetical protein [Longimicrobiales bacterium]